jgi:hypothetical protein
MTTKSSKRANISSNISVYPDEIPATLRIRWIFWLVTMPSQESDNLLLLALTGFCSGVLTSVLPSLLVRVSPGFFSLTEVIFGAAMAWYFWRFRGVRSSWKLLAFAAASIFAYQVASAASMFSPSLSDALGFSSGGPGQIPSDRFFAGGFVGAVILFAAGFFFLSSRTRSKGFVSIAFLLSLVSGALGVFGWALGNFIGTYSAKIANSTNVHFSVFSLYGRQAWQFSWESPCRTGCCLSVMNGEKRLCDVGSNRSRE